MAISSKSMNFRETMLKNAAKITKNIQRKALRLPKRFDVFKIDHLSMLTWPVTQPGPNLWSLIEFQSRNLS